MSTVAASPILAHVSIRASAGSGKTYQLTNRYLRLIAAGAPPANILATTFTRLAAGQIRDRILLRLAEAVDDPTKLHALSLDLDQRLSAGDAMAMLRTLANQVHRMQVRTLDSFFGSVVRSFAFELGLPPGCDIVEEHEIAPLRAEALQLMLDERKPQELIDLLRLLTQGTSERSVMNAMDRVISDLHEVYQEAGDAPWECVPKPRKGHWLSPPALAEAIAAFELCPAPTDRKSLIKAWTADLNNARSRDWDAFVEKGLACKIALGESTYGSTQIPAEVCKAYAPLVNHARAELIKRIAEQTLATRDLLRLFDAHYRQLKLRRHALTFTDVTNAMSWADDLGSLQDICFRLDAQLHHVLLDEFQDTSITQWRALQPIVHEVISNLPPERSFCCVGDVKQSIYTWRDAAPEVLDALPALLRGSDGSSAICEQTLAKSWRSSQVVIDVVNRVFSSLAANAALDEAPDAANLWLGGFQPHEVADHLKSLPGRVELRTAPRAEKNGAANQKLVRLRAAADLIAELHRTNPSAQIAVLTRSNAAVARLLFELGQRRVPCSGRGGGPLTDAPAVNAILDLLQLADHPDDTIATFNVATSPLGSIVALLRHDQPAARQAVAQQTRRKLITKGYAATIARLVEKMLPHCDDRESRRLLQLVDLALQYEPNASLRPSDFIGMVERTAVADPQAAPVQVMTVHQAKGLEFDAVVLPELEAPLAGVGHPSVVIERNGPTGPIARICRWMNETVREFVPELQPLFDRHRLRNVRESLCLLYVAMTRAKQGLYMLIDPPPDNERTFPRKMSGVLRSALVGGDIQPDSIVFEHGDADWPCNTSQAARSKTAGAASPSTITFAGSLSERDAALLRGVAAEPASAESAPSLNWRWRDDDSRHRARGIAMHAMFQQIEWLNEFRPDDEALIQCAVSIAPRLGIDWARTQRQDFLTLLTSPSLAAILSTPADTSRFAVYRELPFARLVDDQLQRGSIDRVVIEHDSANAPIAATIIDFKTDAIDAVQASLCADAYRSQLEAYREVVSHMFRISLDQITLKLVFVAPGVIVDLAEQPAVC
jgi:ATP-dependent helicase/nuclease subunit A